MKFGGIHGRTSDEFTIDREVEDLIGKMVGGTITNEEKVAYQQMVARRSRLMKPDVAVYRRGYQAKLRA